jgi:hypothetical protein
LKIEAPRLAVDVRKPAQSVRNALEPFQVAEGCPVVFSSRARSTGNVFMSDAPYAVSTRPCTIHAGRFRWDIMYFGTPILSSPDSFPTELDALNAGTREIGKLAALM